jgi:hypothetical protein
MSNKPGYSYGIDRELEEKLAAKYDPVLEAEVWILGVRMSVTLPSTAVFGSFGGTRVRLSVVQVKWLSLEH